ncbi:MAG: LamG domain-containing protein [Nanoarchaeota archaeon]|nr:LamG domain-containing protein [Nanoarchaeota archaeon]
MDVAKLNNHITQIIIGPLYGLPFGACYNTMYGKKRKTNSMSYVINRRKSKVALAVFLLILSMSFISLIAQQTNSWSLASNNYTSSLSVITGGGITDTSSTNYQTDVAVAQSVTGSMDSGSFGTMLGFFFSMGAFINQPPTISSVDVTPNDPKTNNDLTCAVSGGSDSDSDPLQYHFDWYKNSVHDLHVLQSGISHVLGSGNTSRGELWNCSVTPYDGTVNGSSLMDSVLINNTVPSNPTVVLSASSSDNLTTDNLTVVISGSIDIDSDSFINITDWRKESVSITVLNLPFDLNDSSAAKDYSTYSNNGTVGGATWTSSGKVGGAYNFDGVDDYIKISPSPINLIESTTSFWFNVNSHSATIGIIETGNQFKETTPYLLVQNNNGALRVYSTTSSYRNIDSISTNVWYHLTIVRNSTYQFVYLNGILKDSIGIDTSGDNQNLNLGVGYNGYFNGSIDEFLVFNHSLSAKQINESYLAGFNNHSLQKLVSEETSVGDSWSVAVTANDGYGESDTIVSNVVEVILDQLPPSNPTVVLNSDSGENYTEGNLTVSISGSTDINDDSFVNVTDWRKEGVSIASLNLPFDLNNDSTAKDYSTYSNDGTVSGATWTSSGKVGGAYSFDGVNDDITTLYDIDGKTEFGIGGWFKTSVSSYGSTMGIMGQSALRIMILTDGDFRIYAYNTSGGGQVIRENYNVMDEEWHYFFINKNETHWQYYRDGNFITSTDLIAGQLDTRTGTWNIGYPSGDYSRFNGTIDEIKIYDFALSAKQINESYLAGFNNHSLQKLVSEETFVGDSWSVAVTANDGYGESDTIVSNPLIIRSKSPSKVVLVSPSNGDDTSINRTQILNWSAATDPENDDLTYEVNVTRITFDGEPSCSVNSISVSSISILNYTTRELCIDDWYEWKIRANDGTNNGEWSDIWNFSVQSYISVNILQNNINFTGLYVGDSINTSGNSSHALKIENAGNVKLNFTIYGNESLWIREYADLNTSYFQFKANNSDDESGTFNTGDSQMDWVNITNYAINLLRLLDYNNTKDTALIDVLVRVPEDEPGGDKDSTLMITSSMG